MTDFFNDNPKQKGVDSGYSGSRLDAISNGDLFDAGEVANQVGFRWPLALTQAAWNEAVAWTDEDSKLQVPQSEYARLFAVVSQCADNVRSRSADTDRMIFSVVRIPRDGKSTKARKTVLQVIAHPGDMGEPVLTIRVPATGT